MKGTLKKILLAAIVLYLGSFFSCYISQIPPPPEVFFIEDNNWTVWHYLSLLLLMCALGLTIAALKLRR